jgi:hypothetical protein
MIGRDPKMNPKIRPRIAPSTWAELERIGQEVGIEDPREVVGYLARNYNREAPAEYSFRFGDERVFSAIIDNDAPIMIRGKARVGKTRTVKAVVERLMPEHPVLVMDPQHEYNGKLVKLEELFTLFENSLNDLYVLRLNRDNQDMSRLELINALRIMIQKFAGLSRWVFVFEEVSSRFADLHELHSFFSEAAKFTRKTIGIEITGTVLDEICRVVEIKS